VALAVANKARLWKLNLRENELEDRGAVIISRALAKVGGQGGWEGVGRGGACGCVCGGQGGAGAEEAEGADELRTGGRSSSAGRWQRWVDRAGGRVWGEVVRVGVCVEGREVRALRKLKELMS